MYPRSTVEGPHSAYFGSIHRLDSRLGACANLEILVLGVHSDVQLDSVGAVGAVILPVSPRIQKSGSKWLEGRK